MNLENKEERERSYEIFIDFVKKYQQDSPKKIMLLNVKGDFSSSENNLLFEYSIPSYENALKYFINTQNWANEENIELFYFSSFDEAWKEITEGDVGGFWGLWDEQEKLKF